MHTGKIISSFFHFHFLLAGDTSTLFGIFGIQELSKRWDLMKTQHVKAYFFFSPRNIVITYLLVASLWVIYSDWALSELIHNEALLISIQTGKGLFFVAVTGIFLFIFIKKGHQQLLNIAHKAEEQEERYRHVLDGSPFLIAIHQNETLVFCNRYAAEMVGHTSEQDILHTNIFTFIHHDYRDLIRIRIRKMYEGEVVENPIELKLMRKNGEILDIEMHSRMVMYNHEPAIQMVAQNISDRVKREEILEQIVQEKTMLLSEVHHRVKNNMAIISGLMQLQSFETENEEVNRILGESISRVKSIALIHDHLYEVQNLTEIRLDITIKNLIDSISGKYTSHNSHNNVRFAYAFNKIHLNINQAVSFGLFLNEVVNEIYRTTPGGCIRFFELAIVNEGKLVTFKISETELPKCDLPQPMFTKRGFLIDLMVQQLEGELQIAYPEEKLEMELSFIVQEFVKGSSANLLFL